jgi:hypothetical protein
MSNGECSAMYELSRPDVEENTVDADVDETVDIRSDSSFSDMVDRYFGPFSNWSCSTRLPD